MGDGDGLPGPTDAWVTLAGLARETSRIRLGTLMSPVTFRYPGPLAISVAQVDEMSGGRVELGLGRGLVRRASTRRTASRSPRGERFDRLEEQLAIITGLWETPAGETFSLRRASTTTVTDSPALPKPVQRPRPPIIIGGRGPRSARPRLAARYADEFNMPFAQPRADRGRVRPGPRRRARRPAGTRAPWSTRPRRRSAAAGTRPSWPAAPRPIGRDWPACAPNGLGGTPARDRGPDRARSPGSAPTRIYLQVLDLHDLDHLELIASEVMPQVR